MLAYFKSLALGCCLCLACAAWGAGKFKITDVSLQNLQDSSRVMIKYQGPLVYPELFIKDSNIIQLTFGDAIVWPKIEKKAAIANSPFEVVLMAYQYNPHDVRIRAVLPFSLKGDENKVTLEVKEEQKLIEVRLPVAQKDNTLATAITAATKNHANKYDENFLAMLLQEKGSEKTAEQPSSKLPGAGLNVKQDKVNSVLAAPKNNSFTNPSTNPLQAANDFLAAEEKKIDQQNSLRPRGKDYQFSLGTYVVKFAVFLAVVLALFYGAVALFKKGMAQNRKKIGLLKDLDSVVVLSTTYLGPKKNLVLVKAHQQVILLATSEHGVHFLSEIRDVPNILKISEKEITGENFDTNLKKAENTTGEPTPVTTAAAAVEATPEKSLTEFLASDAAQTKLAQDLQKKVRPLRPIQ